MFARSIAFFSCLILCCCGLGQMDSFGQSLPKEVASEIRKLNFVPRATPGDFDLLGYLYDNKKPLPGRAVRKGHEGPLRELVEEERRDPQNHRGDWGFLLSGSNGLSFASRLIAPRLEGSLVLSGIKEIRWEAQDLQSVEISYGRIEDALLEAERNGLSTKNYRQRGNYIMNGALTVRSARLAIYGTGARALDLRAGVRNEIEKADVVIEQQGTGVYCITYPVRVAIGYTNVRATEFETKDDRRRAEIPGLVSPIAFLSLPLVREQIEQSGLPLLFASTSSATRW